MSSTDGVGPGRKHASPGALASEKRERRSGRVLKSPDLCDQQTRVWVEPALSPHSEESQPLTRFLRQFTDQGPCF